MGKTRSSDAARPALPRTIEPETMYLRSEFMARTGFGEAAMRSLRRQGLPCRYIGKRCFILGRDFIELALKADEEGGA